MLLVGIQGGFESRVAYDLVFGVLQGSRSSVHWSKMKVQRSARKEERNRMLFNILDQAIVVAC
jgi:hypothetical protein